MIYYLDSMELAVIKRVKSRLYDEMTRLTADDRRDLANALDAVVYNVERYGEATEKTAGQGNADHGNIE